MQHQLCLTGAYLCMPSCSMLCCSCSLFCVSSALGVFVVVRWLVVRPDPSPRPVWLHPHPPHNMSMCRLKKSRAPCIVSICHRHMPLSAQCAWVHCVFQNTPWHPFGSRLQRTWTILCFTLRCQPALAACKDPGRIGCFLSGALLPTHTHTCLHVIALHLTCMAQTHSLNTPLAGQFMFVHFRAGLLFLLGRTTVSSLLDGVPCICLAARCHRAKNLRFFGCVSCKFHILGLSTLCL